MDVFRVGFRRNVGYEILLTKMADEAFDRLGLPRIPIRFNDEENCSYFDYQNCFINIDLDNIIGNDTKTWYNYNYLNLNEIPPITQACFVLYHEIGHYIQFHRYRKWTDRLIPSYNQKSTHKLEVNACKIAVCLLNRFINDHGVKFIQANAPRVYPVGTTEIQVVYTDNNFLGEKP